jgi:hypothetical protein
MAQDHLSSAARLRRDPRTKYRPFKATAHQPHYGTAEIARRKRQIDAGQLQVTDESGSMRSIRLAKTGLRKVGAID